MVQNLARLSLAISDKWNLKAKILETLASNCRLQASNLQSAGGFSESSVASPIPRI